MCVHADVYYCVEVIGVSPDNELVRLGKLTYDTTAFKLQPFCPGVN